MQPSMEKNQAESVSENQVKGQELEEGPTLAPIVDQKEDVDLQLKEQVSPEKKEPDEQVSQSHETPEKDGKEQQDTTADETGDKEENDKEETKADEEKSELKDDLNNQDAADNFSASSSPSALHIHLEEDKEENSGAAEPSLPQVSSVVSLSDEVAAPATPVAAVVAAQEKVVPAPSPLDNSNASNDSNPRRTTLKLKRGIEISYEVDRDGQPVTSNEQQQQQQQLQQQRVENEGQSSRKRAKLNETLDLNDDPELLAMDANATAEAITRVQKDIRTLRFMAKQKEKEWNYILKLMKFKEEQQAKLMRRKEVLRIINSTEKIVLKKPTPAIGTSSSTPTFALTTPSPMGLAASSGGISAPPSAYSSSSSLHSLINQSLTSIMSNKNMKVTAQPPLAAQPPPAPPAQAAANANTNSSRTQRQRPILPKTTVQAHGYHDPQLWTSSSLEPNSSGGHDLSDLRRPTQGIGTVSVQSLIADYRAKHPEEVPIRGRRIRSKADQESPTPPTTDNSGMSFKDVLMQFAKMSRGQSQGSDGMAGVTASNNGSSGGSSSAAALQNLAAVRNARSSTSPALGGSILQSALSGSRAPNSGFAPTLAQLLTSTAEQQQQQQQQQHHQQQLQQQQSLLLGQTSIGTSNSEVLTLSNLLATSKGHVTITSERETTDDVILIGNSSQNRSGPLNVSSGPKSSNGDIPKCQGCNERVAQFVCAGCSSQWYCSRECQVAAWEDHSENCVG